ncbi:MAG: hypothetical protein U5L45_23455 [Saprospiraceae bacterium]|nr:hypothetical protein [Saprospiraceae bacterium]
MSFQMFCRWGQRVCSGLLSILSGHVLLNVSGLPTGVYFAEIKVKETFVREKVVKN